MRHEETNSLLISLLLHAIILAVFIISFEWNAKNFVLQNSAENSQIVNAVFVNQAKIQLPDPTPFPPPKSFDTKPIKPKATPLPVKVKSEPKKQSEPQIQKKTIAIPDSRKKVNDIEKQLLADIEKIKKTKKKTQHKNIEKELEKELKAASAKSLEQQLLKEQNRISSAQMEKMQGIVDKYKALILQAIAQHWLVPMGADKHLTTELLIRIAPGGSVLDVQLVKSSGDEALDRSAQTAVFKASPLPVPLNSEEFEPFRQFILKVKPENVITRDADVT